MASKKSSKSKAKSKVMVESVGENQMTISAAALKDLAKTFDNCKDRAADATGELSEATKGYVEKGLNTVAWGLANRFRRAAQRDPLVARILWEDFLDYFEKLGIEDMLASNMFADPKKKPTQIDFSERRDTTCSQEMSETEIAF